MSEASRVVTAIGEAGDMDMSYDEQTMIFEASSDIGVLILAGLGQRE